MSTQSEVDKKFWKSIWSLEVPNKFKNLVWRACRNSLPTQENLTRRTLADNPIYDRCSLQAEDSLHALWSCSGLDEVWEGDRWNFRQREVLCRWMVENGKSMELFAILVRSIWHQRNKTRMNQACCLTKDLQQSAEERWNEIKRYNLTPEQVRSKPQARWKAPPPNKYKINYDGAISNADNTAGIGVVVRDCHGEVIAFLIQQLDQAYQPVEVEAMATCRAVELGSELGLDCAIAEGDSKAIMKALRCKDNGLTPFAHLINDVSLFSGLFSELLYSHIERDGNKVAHSLARIALTSLSCTMSMEDVPFYTLPFV